jgi:hypothetical protein
MVAEQDARAFPAARDPAPSGTPLGAGKVGKDDGAATAVAACPGTDYSAPITLKLEFSNT